MSNERMNQTGAGMAPVKAEGPLLIEAEKIFDRMTEVNRAVERRAYELFAERGYQDGHDLEDWVRAESEFLAKLTVRLEDEESALVALVGLPDGAGEAVEVGVEPRRLFIYGRTAKAGAEQTTKRSEEFFCSVELPYEIETSGVKASMKEGTLEISMPKRQTEADEATTADTAGKSAG